MAGFTETIGFMTGVLILPQRQTALVAKQATQLDLLSGGRFRMGIGVGWNAVEYNSLGYDFKTRGARVEEQIAILRELWTRELVNIEGSFDTIDDARIIPLPTQPISIWIGGTADIVLQRAARISDGYVAGGSIEQAKPLCDRYWSFAEEYGTKDKVGLHTRLVTESTPESEWESFVTGWDQWARPSWRSIRTATRWTIISRACSASKKCSGFSAGRFLMLARACSIAHL